MPAHPSRLATAAALTLVLTLACASLATGQEVPPEAKDPGEATVDTEYTPVAKETDLWTQVGGSEFESHEIVEGSPSPATVDFFATDFIGENEGFAGGAACADPNTPFEGLETCPRAPALYRYSQAPGEDPRWQPVELPGAGEPGYVGGIAWIGPGRALAVGGTGIYPEREPPAGDPDPAGTARAWLYADGSWSELEDLPTTDQGAPMAGLSAIDCSPREADGEFCVTGGLRQLWHWRSGAFAESFTPQSPPEELDDGAGFQFRVRGIRFNPEQVIRSAGTDRDPEIAAVTSGCCTNDTTNRTPRILLFDGTRWSIRLAAFDVDMTGGSATGDGAPGRSVHPPQSLGDSYIGQPLIGREPFNSKLSISFVISPGGPPQPIEAASRIVRVIPPTSDLLGPSLGTAAEVANSGRDGAGTPGYGGFLLAELTNPRLSSARFVAGDGDFARQTNRQLTASTDTGKLSDEPTQGGDGIIDWAVGELRSTGQAIAYNSTKGLVAEGAAVDCPGDPQVTATGALADCKPADPADVQEGADSERLLRLPSFALNAINFAPQSSSAWAVGDKGALLQLGGFDGATGAGAVEPSPPKLGAARSAPLADDDAYSRFGRPPTAEPGDLPGAGERPPQRFDEPRFVPEGTADPNVYDAARPDEQIGQIVASRNGDEAWALGPGHVGGLQTAGGSRALNHWDGDRWTRCDPLGLPGRLRPDPACADLADIWRARVGRDAQGVKIFSAARVPLERDADPRNDDEFEIVAVGDGYKPPGGQTAGPFVIRYRDGRWSVDERSGSELASASNTITGLAFTAPDDGWLVGSDTAFAGSIFHFDGDRWTKCTAAAADACGSAGRLPTALGRPNGIIAVGARLYLFGQRVPQGDLGGAATSLVTTYPMILSKDPGEQWTAEGGYDPGFDPATAVTSNVGRVGGVSVTQLGNGEFAGWATGRFGTNRASGEVDRIDATAPVTDETQLMRLAGGAWTPWKEDDAAADYDLDDPNDRIAAQPLSFTGPAGEERSFILPRRYALVRPTQPMLSFRPGGDWEVMPTPFMAKPKPFIDEETIQGVIKAAVPDNQGGMWLAVRQVVFPGYDTFYYRWTDSAPGEVFDDVPHPIREQAVASAAGPDGSLWVATASRTVYRFDRVTGWAREQVPGWDPGRVATRPAAAAAIAIGADGGGLLVGEGGRIADLSPEGLRLDPAAGVSCRLKPEPPCGSGQHLRSVAIAPDGSALAGGDGRALLWRPPGGEMSAIPPPPAPPDARITAISIPTATSAWLATGTGQIWAGQLAAGSWSWELEDLGEDGRLLSQDPNEKPRSLDAIELEPDGTGLAVGSGGVVLERDADGEWRRLDIETTHDLTAIALEPGPGRADVIGGELGIVLARRGDGFVMSRRDDYYSPPTIARTSDDTAHVVGLELIPGTAAGELEAWGLSQVPDGEQSRRPLPTSVLHYSSDPSDPLLDGRTDLDPLPDTPDTPGALSFAAFGRSECHFVEGRETCVEPHTTEMLNDAVMAGAREEIAGGGGPGADPSFSILTGDAVNAAGREHGKEGGPGLVSLATVGANTPVDVDVMHRRWVETVGEPMVEAGIPILGALGAQDLEGAGGCADAHCPPSSGTTRAGTSAPWQAAMAGMATPWGSGDATARDGVSFVPVGSATPATGGEGAATHYAADVLRNGETVARLVVTDTSLRSLAASEPNQNPSQPQTAWLDEVLCFQGSANDAGGVHDCTREPGQETVVVTNTPTYTYAPGLSPTEVQTDATAFEATMLRYDVSAVVAGRLGWSGTYYTLAPGLHCPGPGGKAPEGPPSSGGANCAQGADSLVGEASAAAGAATGGDAGVGEIPYVVAASGGGLFGMNGEVDGSASDGFWHGYSVIHLDPESGEVTVEQRPVLDWISLHADGHEVSPRERLGLVGEGREVGGIDTPFRYDEINSASITHRYDLLLADPKEPWMPLQSDTDGPEACGPYTCLPERIGSVDRTSGDVKAGDGRYPETFALALLSVGAKSASYPLVFSKSPSFAVKVAKISPAVPKPNPNPPPKNADQEPPPPPGNPPIPNVPGIEVPAVPVPPAIPLLAASALAEPTPPVPPAPPPPSQQPAPLDLTVAPTGLSVSPPTTLIQPPTPPVNPAPPGGARREARQRQAAAQKSGADAEEAGSDSFEGVDMADKPSGPEGSAMTRHEHSFTAYRPSADSGVPAGLLYSGGIALMAIALTAGWSSGRPTPRRREPELPAPAWSRGRHRP